ncbi:MAG: hypothetical protein WCB63_02335, partial [Polyangiales bacterium]
MLSGEASILDTLLPELFVEHPRDARARYVLEQQILFDACVDFVGKALRSYYRDQGVRRLRVQSTKQTRSSEAQPRHRDLPVDKLWNSCGTRVIPERSR